MTFEEAQSWLFFFIGLGFFMAVIHYVCTDSNRQDETRYNRRLNEKREFGFNEEPPEPTQRSRRFRK